MVAVSVIARGWLTFITTGCAFLPLLKVALTVSLSSVLTGTPCLRPLTDVLCLDQVAFTGVGAPSSDTEAGAANLAALLATLVVFIHLGVGTYFVFFTKGGIQRVAALESGCCGIGGITLGVIVEEEDARHSRVHLETAMSVLRGSYWVFAGLEVGIVVALGYVVSAGSGPALAGDTVTMTYWRRVGAMVALPGLLLTVLSVIEHVWMGLGYRARALCK